MGGEYWVMGGGCWVVMISKLWVMDGEYWMVGGECWVMNVG